MLSPFDHLWFRKELFKDFLFIHSRSIQAIAVWYLSEYQLGVHYPSLLGVPHQILNGILVALAGLVVLYRIGWFADWLWNHGF